MKKKAIIISCICVAVVLSILIGFLAYANQYASIQYATNFTKTNNTKFWYTENKQNFELSKAQANSISLEKLFTGQTVYFTKDNKPFVVSGSSIVYLQQNGQNLSFQTKDTKSLRTEVTGQKLFIGTQANVDAENTKIKNADNIRTNGAKTTALIVNNELVSSNANIYTDEKQNTFIDIAVAMKYTGVSFHTGASSIVFSFADANGNKHRFNIAIAKLRYQPWVEPNSRNVYPAISKIDGKYYISQSILKNVFGFNVLYNGPKKYIEITTDKADVVKSVVTSEYTINQKYVIPTSEASAMGLIDSNGILKDNAEQLYDQSVAAAQATQVAQTQKKTEQQVSSETEKTSTAKVSSSKPSASSSSAPTYSQSNTSTQQPVPAGFNGNEFNGCSQLIVVTADGMHTRYATTSTYEKNGNAWNKVLSGIGTLIGENGMVYADSRVQDTNTTPAGLFDMGFTFGWASNPGTAMEYKQADSNSYWDENSGSATYNRWVEGNPGGDNEQLATEPLYKYAAVIEFNWNQVPNRGAGIFLHIKPGHYTAGCVGIDEGSLVSILKWMNPSKNPKILIIPQSSFNSYYK